MKRFSLTGMIFAGDNGYYVMGTNGNDYPMSNDCGDVQEWGSVEFEPDADGWVQPDQWEYALSDLGFVAQECCLDKPKSNLCKTCAAGIAMAMEEE